MSENRDYIASGRSFSLPCTGCGKIILILRKMSGVIWKWGKTPTDIFIICMKMDP